MKKHDGQVIQDVVRKSGRNMTELASSLNVNRRTLYYWFASEILKRESIVSIGNVLRYDFSNEFPDVCSSGDFTFRDLKPSFISEVQIDTNMDWKIKYLDLLELYNEALIKIAANEESSVSA